MVLGDKSLCKKCVFLIGVCCGFTELDVIFKKCAGFSRGSLMILLDLNYCDNGFV